MTGDLVPAPEFSRPVDVAGLGERIYTREFAASIAECAALARRFDLHALTSLSASVTVRRLAGRIVELQGEFTAALEQVCVVTLEPVPARIVGSFRQIYSPDLPGEGLGEVVIDAVDEEDDPEPLIGGQIDLGEAVAQRLAVALDPYPRRPEAQLLQTHAQPPEAPAEERAFAALARLRRN